MFYTFFTRKTLMAGRGLIATGYYPDLFRTIGGSGRSEAGVYYGRNEGAENSFNRRYGIARLYERNNNLLEVLRDPPSALQKVNTELLQQGTNLAGRYEERLREFRKLGFGEEESIARADIMTGRELENEVSLMQLKYPYAMGGAAAGGWDPVQAILMGSSGGVYNPSVGQKFQQANKALSSNDMYGGAKKKKLKAKFKRKFKRRYRRRKV